MIGFEYRIETSGEEEVQPHGLPPAEYVKTLALPKAQPVAYLHPQDCVIGADTIVYLEGDILGKPHDPEVAKAYLARMAGQGHVGVYRVAVL
jgi:septum formation protein